MEPNRKVRRYLSKLGRREPLAEPPEAVRQWMAEIGTKGGRQRSEAKTAAVRLNARKRWPKRRMRRRLPSA